MRPIGKNLNSKLIKFTWSKGNYNLLSLIIIIYYFNFFVYLRDGKDDPFYIKEIIKFNKWV